VVVVVVRSSTASVITLAAADADKCKGGASMDGGLAESSFGFTPSRARTLSLRRFVTGLGVAGFDVAGNPIGDTLCSVSLPEERIVVMEGVGSMGLSKLMEL
jgi:hypothetical protein